MTAIFTGLGAGFDRGSGSVLGGSGLLGSSILGRGGESLFLNAANGNLLVSQRDEFLIGRGLDALVSRTYNSQGDLSDDNGDNWRQGYDRRVYGLTGTLNTVGSTVKRVSGDGSEITYTWNATKSAYIATDGAGSYDQLTNSANAWTWTDGDSQVTETYQAYNAIWRITSQSDTDGNSLTFSYTGDKLTLVTTADGSTITYSWSGNNLSQVTTGYTDLATSTAKTLTRTRYTYDGSNRLSSVTVDLSPGDNSIADGKVFTTTYTYDGTSKRLASIAGSDGSRIEIRYDASNRVDLLTQTSAVGVTRVSTIAYSAGYTTITDPLGQAVRLDHNADGSLAKITAPPATSGAAAQVTQFFYNANGDVTKVTDALLNDTVYSNFDSNGNAQTITDRLNNVVTRTYGTKNELLTQTSTSSDLGSSGAAHTSRYAYDAENHLRYMISAEGYVTEYSYNTAGQLVTTTEYPEQLYDVSALASGTALTEAQLNSWRTAIADKSSAKIIQNLYDARGNLTSRQGYGIASTAGAGLTTEGSNTVTSVYDQAGNLLSRNAQGRNVETFVYDGLGRLTASVDVNGGTTSYVFDDANSKTIVTLANGLIQTSTYNKAGELISFLETAPAATPAAAVGTATYGYDKNGRLRWQLDATGRKSYFVYDAVGRKVADVSAQGDVIEYRYDANNRMVASIAHGTRLTAPQIATLDNENAVINPTTLMPSANAADVWSWNIYDKEGRLRQAIAGDGSTTIIDYDGAGRLIKSQTYYNKLTVTGFKTTLPTTVTAPTANATYDQVTRTFYDKDGRLVGALDGEGYLSRVVYDKAGQKVETIGYANATTPTYRASGTYNQLLSTVTVDAAKDRHTYYSYDGQGQLRYVVDGQSHVVETVYDSAGQATTLIQYAGTISTTADFSFDNIKGLVTSAGLGALTATRRSWSVYDSAGRIAYAVDAENAVTAFSYNSSGQVTKATRFATLRSTTSLPTKATMDAWATGQAGTTGNRITRNYYDTSGVLRYSVDGEGYVSRQDVDAEGRLVRTYRWANAITVADSATYDTVHGLVTSSGGTTAETASTYDALGRLETSTDGEGVIRRFEYNPNGTVQYDIAAYGTADESKTHFVYDGAGRVLAEHRAYGTAEVAITQFEYDGAGNVTKITDPNLKITLQAFDHLGQLLTRTDALAGITSVEYDAFGNVVKTTDARLNASYNYYDNLNRLIVTRDAENYVTKTIYTAFGQIESVTRFYNAATGTPSVGTLPTYTLNAAKDALTQFEYDRLGRAKKTIDAEGFFEQYTLNAFGNRIGVINKLGGTITNSFDKRGLLVAETLPMASVNNAGTVVATTVTNKFEYDSRGNRTKMIEAFGLAEQRTTNYVYDKNDRLITKTSDAVITVGFNDFTGTNAVTVTTTSGVVPTESYVYDRRGNLIQVTDALGGRSVSYYDDLNRKIGEVGSLGTLTRWTYDAAGNRLSEKVYGDAVTVPTLPSASPPAPINASNYRETLYTYDNLNRLATSSVASVLVGSWNGSSGVAPASVTITTSFAYDANGNVVTTTDANLGTVFAYYDKLGRKTAQVDQEKYLTSWTFDSEGNALSERRYATQATGTITTTAPPSVATHANDRVTSFTYDENGHRLTETRTGVVAWSVSTSNGALTQTATNAVITYTYNGLGQVLTKVEATGDSVAYTYDQTGRLTRESRAAYLDHLGASVTPTVAYSYDGLNNLSQTRQGGAVQNAADRITKYTYGAGGRLASLLDAAGGTHAYDYDAAGNVVRDSYTRLKADGTSLDEGILYRRDLLGRITAQTIATKLSATSWTRGDSQNSQYNAYGDVAQRGVNGLWQETFEYDNAGRLTKTNSGDGVWRFFVYDANGNQTLAIESEGNDYAATSLATVLASLGSVAGATFVDGVNTTITQYDKRNQAITVRMPQRELKAGDPRVTILTSQTMNAFGEVASTTDARGYTTTFAYNTMGRLISKVMPTVNVTSEAGVVTTAAPTETYYYDLAGRLVGSRDANGNLNSRTLLAGSGYGGAEALVAAEYHADTGIARTFHDVYGDARILRNELNVDDTRTYDAMGRLITQIHRGALLTDNYTYDLLGQRITHWNSFLGSLNKETTDFDLQGRVTRVVAFGGDTTITSYAWDATLANSGMSAVAVGGWTQTDTYANFRTMVVTTDMFGRDLSKVDLGSHSFTYAYDKAGRQTTRTTSGEILTTTWLNSGLAAKLEFGPNDYSTFTYDANGNRLSEYTTRVSVGEYVVAQNASATYDALNRLVTWNDAGGSQTPVASKVIEYDLNGNIRRNSSTYRTFDDYGVISAYDTVKDLWFRHDSMNRVTVNEGALVNGVITYGGTHNPEFIEYDAAGQRMKVSRKYHDESSYWVTTYYDPNYGTEEGYWVYIDYENVSSETYEYRADGVMVSVRQAANGYTDNGDGSITYYDAPNPGTLKGSFTYDAMGRLTRQIDYAYDNSAGYDRTITHNGKGQITYENVERKQWDGNSWDLFTDQITTTYGTDAGYALGAAVQITTNALRFGNDSDAPDPRTTYTYNWYDGAVAATQSFTTNINDSSPTTYTTTYYTSPSGVLTQAIIDDNRDRRVDYINDMSGQVIVRDEDRRLIGSSYNVEGPREVWHRFNGREMQFTSNNAASTAPTNYVDSAYKRTAKPSSTTTGMFAGGAAIDGYAYGDSDASFEGITTFKQGSAGGRYTVRGGETLQSIAQAVWGDSGYWYKVAEANGLSADAFLVDGQTLTLPAGVTRSSNNASTFKPYDASEAMGDTAPTRIKPPKPKKAGLFGKILLAVIQIAVTVILTALLTPVLGPAAPFVAAVGANIVKQGVGVATGIQPEFSWKEVGITALTAALSGPGTGNPFIDAARGAIVNAQVQGIAVATGLQNKFDWAGVAAAGISAGVSTAVGNSLARPLDGQGNPIGKANTWNVSNGIGNIAARSAAGLIANAATRSVATGTDFGDNILAGLPDVIGQTIGGMIADGVARRRGAGAAASSDEAAGADTAAAEQSVVGDQADGGTTEAQEGDIIVIGSRDAVYRPEIDGLPFFLAQQYTRNPRVRTGGNGGPPLNDPTTIGQVVGPVINTPAGPVLGIVDNFLDLSGPSKALQYDLLKALRSNIVAGIEQVDPNWVDWRLTPPGGDSLEGLQNSINQLRGVRAVKTYQIKGDIGPLQVETLRHVQGLVDIGYGRAVQRYDAGLLNTKLGRNEAIGNFVDRYVRNELRAWFNQLGVSTGSGSPIQVNSRAYLSDGSYRIPDARVGNLAIDYTLSMKTAATPQVRGFFAGQFHPAAVAIVRPSAIGQTYVIPRPR